MDIPTNLITALIGPSGCGKSTFLRCLNRMNDTIPGTHVEGQIILNGKDIYSQDIDLANLTTESRDGISKTKSISSICI